MRFPFFYGWVIVGVAFISTGIGVNARTAFSLLFPPILKEFGWDRAVIAGAFSFGFVVSAGLSPTLGWLMDRHGPRAVMGLGVAMMSSGLMLASQISAPWHLYLTLGVLVGGGSVCLGYTGQSLFLPNWFVRRRGLAVSLAFAGVGIGSIVLLPWMQFFMDRSDWRSACWTLGLLLAVVLAPLTLLLRRRPEDMGLRPDGDAQPLPGAARPASNIVDPAWAAIDWTLARALRTARFWWIALAFFSGGFAWYAVQVHQTKYLIEIGFGTADAAWALGAVALVAVPGQIVLGHLSDRIGREWSWTIGCLGFVLCYLLLIALARWPSGLLLAAMVLVQGFLGYGLTSVMGAIVLEIFQGRRYATIFGTVMIGLMAGSALGPWLAGALHDRSGSYVTAFWLAVGLSLVSIAAIWLAAPRKVRMVAGRVERLARVSTG
ncbi:MAG: MFS transporter [Burkholderiales bacterium]|nr:MFS transporter [Burkholderiales bacterium]